jgi:hypothetical protein
MKRLLLVWWLVACGSPAMRPAPSQPEPMAPRPVAAAPLFEMHSGFWLNLHLRLHYAATGRRPVPLAPPDPDDPAWAAAVELYRRRFAEHGGFAVLFHEQLVALDRHLAALGSEPLRGVDDELASHLEAAAALVRPRWSEDDARNRAWWRALEPALAEHGAALRDELVAIYGTPWPSAPVRVDVSCFAGPVGAFTLDDPPHVTISSCLPSYAGAAALEMIFHEASHVLVGGVEAKLADEARRRGWEAPRDLWHALLFYTAGEVVRRRVDPSYLPYATQNELRMVLDVEPALRSAWQPYLDGAVGRDAAIAALIEAVGPPR